MQEDPPSNALGSTVPPAAAATTQPLPNPIPTAAAATAPRVPNSTPAAPAAHAAPMNAAGGWATVSSNNRRGDVPVPPPPPVTRPPPTQQPAALLPNSFESGMMFGCKKDTYDENISRQLFGLPEHHFHHAQRITDRTVRAAAHHPQRSRRRVGPSVKRARSPKQALSASAPLTYRAVAARQALFLFNYSTRQLHGVFVRNGPPGLNLEPGAWAHHRKPGAPTDRSPYARRLCSLLPYSHKPYPCGVPCKAHTSQTPELQRFAPCHPLLAGTLPRCASSSGRPAALCERTYGCISPPSRVAAAGVSQCTSCGSTARRRSNSFRSSFATDDCHGHGSLLLLAVI